MSTQRMEAFSDGVIAIIITIMVLGLQPPRQADWRGLLELMPALLTYLLSFIYVGIYWNNHHHMLHLTRSVNGAILWGNLHLLFWLSLIPFTTGWMEGSGFAAMPTATYGFVLLMAAVAYVLLQGIIIHHQGKDSPLKAAVGNDRKGKWSVLCYLAAMGLSFVHSWLAVALYAGVALLWLIPDRRIEGRIHQDV